MKLILGIIGIIGLLVSAVSYIYTQIFYKPAAEELDEDYWEFEDENPKLQIYRKYSRRTFRAMAISALLIFIAAVI